MSLSLRLNLKRYAERYHHHLLSDGARFKEAKEDDESDLNNTSESKNDVAAAAAAAAVDSKQNQLFDSKRHKISLIGSGENGEKINANKKRDNGTTRSTIELLSGENKPSLASVFLLTDNKQAYSQFQVKPFRFELFEEERDEAVSKEQQHWILEKTIEFKLLTSQINTVNRNSNTTDKQFREEEQQQQEQLQQQQQQPESISLDVS